MSRFVGKEWKSVRDQGIKADFSFLAQGDVNSKESLEKALAGAYAVFAVTNYWEKMDPELEKRQGRLIADVSVVSLHC